MTEVIADIHSKFGKLNYSKKESHSPSYKQGNSNDKSYASVIPGSLVKVLSNRKKNEDFTRLIVLWRAIIFAAPAGAIIWLICNIHIADQNIALWLIHGLDPMGLFIGLNGVILLAYIVAIPANEIVIPTILMLTALTVGSTGAGTGVLFEGSANEVSTLLHAGGWTTLTAINLMLFSLLHNPCSTTIYTIYKETGSRKWTAVATLLPVFYGLIVCFLVTKVWYFFA